jgi:predicted DNA-binding transcriptional regulator YafY
MRPRASALARLERLDRLAGLLAADDGPTVGALAAALAVSPRTVARDLALLRLRGVPVEGEPGRGGGLRLDRNWSVGRLALDHQEAVDLMISLAIAEQMESPLFMAGLRSVRRKLAASFAPGLRGRVEGLKARVLVGQPASAAVLASVQRVDPSAIRALHRAFLHLRTLEIDYRDQAGTASRRVIEPHFLFFNAPLWYVLAWDRLRGGIRSFRCDRIVAARVGLEDFRPRPRSDFRAALADLPWL